MSELETCTTRTCENKEKIYIEKKKAQLCILTLVRNSLCSKELSNEGRIFIDRLINRIKKEIT